MTPSRDFSHVGATAFFVSEVTIGGFDGVYAIISL